MTDPLISRLGIVELDTDIRRLSRAELAPHFASSSGRLVLTKLVRSIIWQAHRRIRDGVEAPVRGNLRTFWYRFVKPVLAHIPDDDETRTDPYDVMLRMFAELVLEHGLLHYSDFDFTDENWENRRLGVERPELVVFTEKTGWVRWLREVHDTFSVTTTALGGAPSALSSEYLVRALEQVGLSATETRLRLIGLVDYDPSGDIIAASFQDQMVRLGWHSVTLETLLHPSHYSPDELEMFAFELPRGQATKTRKWLQKTGGIGGEPRGLEAESMPYEVALELVRRRLAVDT